MDDSLPSLVREQGPSVPEPGTEIALEGAAALGRK